MIVQALSHQTGVNLSGIRTREAGLYLGKERGLLGLAGPCMPIPGSPMCRDNATGNVLSSCTDPACFTILPPEVPGVGYGAAADWGVVAPGGLTVDAYWAAQPPAVQQLRNMPTGVARDQLATQLMNQGYTIDYDIMVAGADPVATMVERGQYQTSAGWTPSANQPGTQTGWGGGTGPAPAGSIKTSTNINDYPVYGSGAVPGTPAPSVYATYPTGINTSIIPAAATNVMKPPTSGATVSPQQVANSRNATGNPVLGSQPGAADGAGTNTDNTGNPAPPTTDIGTWLKDNWAIVAGVAVGGILLIGSMKR